MDQKATAVSCPISGLLVAFKYVLMAGITKNQTTAPTNSARPASIAARRGSLISKTSNAIKMQPSTMPTAMVEAKPQLIILTRPPLAAFGATIGGCRFLYLNFDGFPSAFV